MSRDFLLFLLIGGLAALVNLVGRIIFNLVVDYQLAIILAYPPGMAVAFLLNRHFVFRADAHPAVGQIVRFALVNLLSLAQIWMVSVGLVDWAFPRIGFTWHAETIGHAIGLGSPVLTSYFAHKHFSFRAGKG
ncbi:GtrA family protein [Aquabacter sp. L1I39]|uniref:GtrA family protein n=1 Tax=Aquabacter sp. L1I39 TaxID=2820278 RepID=UPI001ADD15D0|nr:GtrA family protein [Aquabacter sp. L1I39]QTL05352.1 GtrA family protein [Aquabacter sp. L1I39]